MKAIGLSSAHPLHAQLLFVLLKNLVLAWRIQATRMMRGAPRVNILIGMWLHQFRPSASQHMICKSSKRKD